MSVNRKFHWLKLKEDFFSSMRIKKLRRLAGGDTYTIIYLKLQLVAMKNDGIIAFSGLENNIAEELALELDEEVENVRVTLSYLLSCGLAETSDDIHFFFPYAVENTGTDTTAAQRMRKARAAQKAALPEGMGEQCSPGVPKSFPERSPDIDREKELEEDVEKEREGEVPSLRSGTSPGATEPPVIVLPLNDGTGYEVSQEQSQEWAGLYPAVDVIQQLRNMKGWLDANPTRRKTRKGVLRFINSWLSREQDRGYTSQKGRSRFGGTTDDGTRAKRMADDLSRLRADSGQDIKREGS